jgi:hypothetical protein
MLSWLGTSGAEARNCIATLDAGLPLCLLP